ncbi:DNA alkylation repair protein [Candidatus Gracilibacteria bacterium]|nr:DNA alkylation repair protein [Candidatus Gracilibacteria bacterium]
MLNKLKSDLKKLSVNKKVEVFSRFFKTGKGEYGQGDKFLGISVPLQRQLAKQYLGLDFDDLQNLLNSDIHEYRLVALLILVQKYSKGDDKLKSKVFKFYLKNTKRVNNRDLVDLSSYHIVGNHLLESDKSILYKLAKSNNLREKRISIVSTYTFIKNHQFQDTFQIAEILLNDTHDLIHKAVGWMLREAGNRDQIAEEKFLKIHYKNMPRTMLRYAIEKFEESKRQKYLKGLI